MTQDIKALLFDLGGVLIDLHPGRVAERWAEHAGREAAGLNWRFVADADYRRHERGEISSPDYLELLRARMDIPLSGAAMLDGWNRIFGEAVAGVEELLAAAAKHRPLYLFSNSNPAHQEYWSARYAPLLRHFRKVFVSSSIGLRKPDAQAFRHVADEMGVSPAEAAFFDDTPENIAGARALGFRSYLIGEPADLRRALHDVLPASGE